MDTMEFKCYDTLSNRYVEIRVSEEVGQFMKRSYWREDIQNRRYYQRCAELDDRLDYHSAYLNHKSIEDQLIEEQEMELLRTAVDSMDERERDMLRLICQEQLTLKEVARELGISPSYASRLYKRLTAKLKQLFDDLYYA